MARWIKVRRGGVAEAFHQRRSTEPSLDEVTDQAGLVHIADDEVVASLILPGLGCSRARLFMIVLAMNERSEAIAGVALDSLPDVEHRTAGRVYHYATDLAEDLKIA